MRHPVQPPDWITGAPILVERSIDIAAAPAAVWAVIADHERWPEWFTALDSVEVTAGASGVGGGRRVTIKRLALDEVFTTWDEDEHFAFAVVGSKIPVLHTMAESVRLTAHDGGTQVVYRQGLEARRGFGKVLEVMWKPAAAGLDEALDNLKVRVESAT